MLVLKILGIAFAVILGIIAVILCLPIRVIFLWERGGELKILAKILWLTFGEEPVPDSSFLDLALRILNLRDLKDKALLCEDVSTIGVAGTIAELAAALGSVLRRLIQLFPHCRIRRFRVDAVCAAPDPADTALLYGKVCAAVAAAGGLLSNVIPFRRSAKEYSIVSDFTASEPTFRMDLRITLHVWNALIAVLRVALDNARSGRYPSQRAVPETSAQQEIAD